MILRRRPTIALHECNDGDPSHRRKGPMTMQAVTSSSAPTSIAAAPNAPSFPTLSVMGMAKSWFAQTQAVVDSPARYPHKAMLEPFTDKVYMGISLLEGKDGSNDPTGKSAAALAHAKVAAEALAKTVGLVVYNQKVLVPPGTVEKHLAVASKELGAAVDLLTPPPPTAGPYYKPDLEL